MFEKRATYKNNSVNVLHNPDFKSGNHDFIHSLDLKIASKESNLKNSDNSEFDLEAEVKSHPDSLFVKCFAIKANETNDNGDWFGTAELKKAYGTFVGVPIFTNHHNNEVENAKGKVVHSWYDDEKDGIYIIARIDAVAYPELARGIKQEYIVGTSMGAQVEQSICSICHNSATKPTEFCNHIKEMKGKKLSGKTECIYKTNGNGNCPICGCGEKDQKILEYVDSEVHEKNYGLKFIENSLVVNPACHECGITEIIDVSKFLKKVAILNDSLPKLLKAASTHPIACDDSSCMSLVNEKDMETFDKSLICLNKFANGLKEIEKAQSLEKECVEVSKNMDKIEKQASEKDIQDLRTAIDLISEVSKKIIDQRQNVDLEFLEDLIQSLSKLQESTDELEQMGFNRLPENSVATETQTTIPGMETPVPGTPESEVPVSPVGESKVTTGPTPSGVGTVTGPLANSLFKMVKNSKSKSISIPLRFGKKRGKTSRKLV